MSTQFRSGDLYICVLLYVHQQRWGASDQKTQTYTTEHLEDKYNKKKMVYSHDACPYCLKIFFGQKIICLASSTMNMSKTLKPQYVISGIIHLVYFCVCLNTRKGLQKNKDL